VQRVTPNNVTGYAPSAVFIYKLFSLKRRWWVMKFADQLTVEQKSLPIKSPKMEQPTTKPKKENLSIRDWENIMGTRRDTYERRNGAVRRK
jgi:hypothetical protein